MPGKTGRGLRPVRLHRTMEAYAEHENKGDPAVVNPRYISMTHARGSSSTLAPLGLALTGAPLHGTFFAQSPHLVGIDAAQRTKQFGGVLAEHRRAGDRDR